MSERKPPRNERTKIVDPRQESFLTYADLLRSALLESLCSYLAHFPEDAGELAMRRDDAGRLDLSGFEEGGHIRRFASLGKEEVLVAYVA